MEYRIKNHPIFFPTRIEDIRNYAVTILYQEKADQIFRSKYKKYHLEYLMYLKEHSKNFQEENSYPLNNTQYNHYQFDKFTAKNGNGIIYSDDPSWQNNHTYIFFLPENPTTFQKEWLQKRMIYFQKLHQIFLHLYQNQNEDYVFYKSIEDYRSSTPYQALKKIIQK